MNTETEQFLAEMMPKLEAVERAITGGDPGPRIALWSHKDPVTLFGANLNAEGWEAVEPAFHVVASWFAEPQEWEYEVIGAFASGDLAYTVGYERKNVTLKGENDSAYTLRVTNVFRREDGQWRVVHRHADFPPKVDDQSRGVQ